MFIIKIMGFSETGFQREEREEVLYPYDCITGAMLEVNYVFKTLKNKQWIELFNPVGIKVYTIVKDA